MSQTITEVAREAGLPTSTLRYYDRLGLLASSGRAENGYRQYDERALERLRFITRAKDLGCSLNEIATLLTAFDKDCGDVQTPLRDLVEGKIAIGQRRIAELIALTAQLQEARHALSAEAAAGPCGPDCACLKQSSQARRPLTVAQLAASEPAIACTLRHEDVAQRISDWHVVISHVTARTSIEGGLRLELDMTADLAEIARLARAEWACCSFFAFSVTVDGRGSALEVRAPAEASELLTSIFGLAA